MAGLFPVPGKRVGAGGLGQLFFLFFDPARKRGFLPGLAPPSPCFFFYSIGIVSIDIAIGIGYTNVVVIGKRYSNGVIPPI